MEDLSTFIWIGIGIIWLLTRLLRGGARKAARQARTKPAASTMTAPTARRTPADRTAAAPTQTFPSGQSAKPIEPR